jgi:hypothetical protein
MSELDDEIEAGRRLVEKIDREYAAEIKKLKEEKAPRDEVEARYSFWGSDHDQAEEKLDGLLTKKLSKRARELDVPLPHYPKYTKDVPDWDRSEHWYRNSNGRFILTQHGRDLVEDLIWKKEERGYSRWSRWVTLTIGLIGALTGLVSVTATNWEKFAAVFGSIWSHTHH